MPTTPEQYFTFDAQTQTITDYDVAGGGTDVVIPSQIGGVDVLHIGNQAFFAKGLTSAVIPEGVLTIEDGYVDTENVENSYGAFGLNFGTEENPFSITFPDSLTYIGIGACAITTLTSVNIGDGVTEIADFAFAECNWLESLALGRSVESIGVGAFLGCALTEFTAPDSLRFIGVSAFEGNPIAVLVLGQNVETIEINAFWGCPITQAILPADMDVGEDDEDTHTLGSYRLSEFYYDNGREAGEYTYDLQTGTWSFEASDPFAGGSEAKIRVTPSGGGRKIMYGGGELIVKISAAGAGKKKMAGGGEARITASTSGGGKKKMAGGGETRITVHSIGTGGRLLKGGGEARITVSAEGGGIDFFLPLELTPDDRFSYELAEADIEITGIIYRTTIEGEDGADDKEIDYLAGTDDYALVIEDNPLLQGGHEQVLTAIYNKLAGFHYRPFDFETLSYPHLWPGDRVTKIIDAEGEEHVSIITNHTFTLNGKSKIEARGETETVRGYATGAPFTPRQKSVLQSVARVEAARKTSSLEQATLRLNELMANSLGFYTTVVELETGAKITYTHDQPTLEESMIIWTWTEQGFAWTDEGWNDGAPVWQYGVTSEGSIIAKLLDVIGIRAEWIQVGSAGDYISGEIDDARDYARDLLNSLADGTYTGGTFIDGTTLYSPNIIGLNILGMSGEFDRLWAGNRQGAHVELGEESGLPFVSLHDDEGAVVTAHTKEGIMMDSRGRITFPYLDSGAGEIRAYRVEGRRFLMIKGGENTSAFPAGGGINIYHPNDSTNPGEVRIYGGGSEALRIMADQSGRFRGDLQVDGLLSTPVFNTNTAGNLIINGSSYFNSEAVCNDELRMRGNQAIRFPYYGFQNFPAGVLRVVRTEGRRYMIWDSHDDGMAHGFYFIASKIPITPARSGFTPATAAVWGCWLIRTDRQGFTATSATTAGCTEAARGASRRQTFRVGR